MAIDSYLHFKTPPLPKKTDKATEVEQQDSASPEIAEEAVVSPEDAASGLPTGKRMHKPY